MHLCTSIFLTLKNTYFAELLQYLFLLVSFIFIFLFSFAALSFFMRKRYIPFQIAFYKEELLNLIIYFHFHVIMFQMWRFPCIIVSPLFFNNLLIIITNKTLVTANKSYSECQMKILGKVNLYVNQLPQLFPFDLQLVNRL